MSGIVTAWEIELTSTLSADQDYAAVNGGTGGLTAGGSGMPGKVVITGGDGTKQTFTVDGTYNV